MHRKRFRIVRSSLQWKLIGCSLGAALGASLVQFVAINALLSDLFLATSAGATRGEFLQRVWVAGLWSLVVTSLFMGPVVILSMILVTLRIAGPVHRMQQDLSAIAEGGPAHPIRLRQGDELLDLCAAINRVLERLPQPSGGQGTVPARELRTCETSQVR